MATIAESAGLVMRRRTIGFDVCFTVGASDRHVCAAERCYLPTVVNGFVLTKPRAIGASIDRPTKLGLFWQKVKSNSSLS